MDTVGRASERYRALIRDLAKEEGHPKHGSIAAVKRRLGVSHSYISKILAGEKGDEIGAEVMEKACRMLRFSREYFWGDYSAVRSYKDFVGRPSDARVVRDDVRRAVTDFRERDPLGQTMTDDEFADAATLDFGFVADDEFLGMWLRRRRRAAVEGGPMVSPEGTARTADKLRSARTKGARSKR